MAIWKRLICGSEFQYDNWGENVVSRVKPQKYAALTDEQHWHQVTNFECAGLARICSHIVEAYPAIVAPNPLGEEPPKCYGIDGDVVYNNDLTMSLSIPSLPDAAAVQSWCDAEFGQGKVVVNG